jgi:hypothetical protein
MFIWHFKKAMTGGLHAWSTTDIMIKLSTWCQCSAASMTQFYSINRNLPGQNVWQTWDIQTQYLLNSSHNPYCYSKLPWCFEFETRTCHKAPKLLLLRKAGTQKLSPPTQSSHCCIRMPPGHFHLTNSPQNDGRLCVGYAKTQLHINTAHCQPTRKANTGIILDTNHTLCNHIYCLSHKWAWCKEKVPN